jgi:hypothetical protein
MKHNKDARTVIKKIAMIYECEVCGRKGLHKFYGHSTSKIAKDYCNGKVRKVAVENMW